LPEKNPLPEKKLPRVLDDCVLDAIASISTGQFKNNPETGVGGSMNITILVAFRNRAHYYVERDQDQVRQ
jgi:phage gp29-like protein